MKNQQRFHVNHAKYIRELFKSTKDGKMPITYYPDNGEGEKTYYYPVTWTADDLEDVIEKFDALKAALTKIGALHHEIENDTKKRQELLTPYELEVYETFIKPFDPFRVSESYVGELHLRAEGETLSDEEYDLLEEHYLWRENESLKRLPFNRTTPYHFVLRAQRYETLVAIGAPEIIANEEARCLAEEMILYYHLNNQEATN